MTAFDTLITHPRCYAYGVLLLCSILGMPLAALSVESPPPPHATEGAAPGYVADALCGECHDEYESYQEVAMAKAFYRPSRDKVIEDFTHNHFYHAPSDRHYEMSLRDGDYWFRRYQLDADGKETNLFERKVDLDHGLRQPCA